MAEHKIVVSLLQSPKILLDGESLAIGLKKASAVLFYLIVNRQASRDELVGLLWADESKELAYRHLRDNLYFLKKHIPVELLIPRGRTMIELNPAIQIHCDLHLFLEHGDITQYQGDFLKGYSIDDAYEYEAWVIQTRNKLRDTYLQRLDQLAKAAVEAEDDTLAEQYWQEYLLEDPVVEDVAIPLIQLYRRRGNYNRATLVYRKLHRAMADFLGIAPLKETTQLYYSIMNEWNHRAEVCADQLDEFLIGRQDIFQKMRRQLAGRNTLRQRTHSFIIQGEAGVGKSHLLNHVLNSDSLSRWTTITTSCFKSKQDEYLHSWHAIVMALVDHASRSDIRIPVEQSYMVSSLFPIFTLTSQSATSRTAYPFKESIAYEAVVSIMKIISEQTPIVLVFEDIQWMDSASLILLDQVIHSIDSVQVAVVATCRKLASPAILSFIKTAQIDKRLQCYNLSPFTWEESVQFINHFSEHSFSQQLKEQIYRDTGGNAFLLTHLLNSLQEQGTPEIMPSDMEQILSYRLAGLNPDGQQVLYLIAMFPDCAPCQVLEHISNKTPIDLLYTCQELCRRSIVSELSDAGNLSFVFSLQEFRELVYSRIRPVNRRIIHLNIANVLSQFSPTQFPNLNSQIIFHYQQGGDGKQAFYHKVKALKRHIYFNYALVPYVEAEDIVQLDAPPHALKVLGNLENELSQLKLIHQQSDELEALACELLYAKGCFCIFKGLYEIGIHAIQTLLTNQKISTDMKALAHEQMVFCGIQQYNTEMMRHHIDHMLVLREGHNAKQYAIIRRYYGYLVVLEGNYKEGRDILRHSIHLLEHQQDDQISDVLQLAYAHNYIGESYRKQGLYDCALEEYQYAANMLQNADLSSWLSVFYTNYAYAAFSNRQYKQAEKLLHKAEHFSLYVQKPGGNKSIICGIQAIYAFVYSDTAQVCARLQEATAYSDAVGSPYEQGVILMIKALLALHCQLSPAVCSAKENGLTDSAAEYLSRSQALLVGKSGAFERTLLHELSRTECTLLADILHHLK